MPVNKLYLCDNLAVTSAGAQSPIGVSGIGALDYTIKLLISSFFALPFEGGAARIAIEESIGSGFSPAAQLWVANVGANFNNAEGVLLSFRKREASGTDLIGEADSFARFNCQEFNGGPMAEMVVTAWIEY